MWKANGHMPAPNYHLGPAPRKPSPIPTFPRDSHVDSRLIPTQRVSGEPPEPDPARSAIRRTATSRGSRGRCRHCGPALPSRPRQPRRRGCSILVIAGPRNNRNRTPRTDDRATAKVLSDDALVLKRELKQLQGNRRCLTHDVDLLHTKFTGLRVELLASDRSASVSPWPR